MSASNLAAKPQVPGSIDRIEVMRRLKRIGGTPELVGETTCKVRTADYVEPEYFATELDVLFRRYPTYVGLSAEMLKPGDYKTRTIGGVPVLVIRGEDGVVRGFRNTCQHRGAPLLTEIRGSGADKLTCRYHGWTYNLQGALVGLPMAKAFPGVERNAVHLAPIQVQEKYGLIFAMVDLDTPLDVEKHLGALGPELESIGLGRLLPAAEESVVTQANWKLAVDTFGESYHLTSLHPQAAQFLLGNGSIVDSYGPHTRLVVPLAGITELIEKPESEWAGAVAGVHFMLHYVIFPSLVVNLRDGAVQVIYIEPGSHVGEVVTTQTQAFDPDLPEEMRKIYEGFFNFSLHGLTVPDDYTMAAAIQKAFAAGSLETVTLGRCEWMLHVLHKERQRLVEQAQTAAKDAVRGPARMPVTQAA